MAVSASSTTLATATDVEALRQEITGLGDQGKYHKAVRKYKQLRQLGEFGDGPTYTAILKSCVVGKIGAVADKIVEDMVQHPPEDGIKVEDLKLALKACALGSRPEEAVAILDMMKTVAILPDLEALTLGMESASRAAYHPNVEQVARRIMKQLRDGKISPDGRYYAALLGVLVKAKRYKEALASFDLMCLDMSFTPTGMHYMAAVRAASRTKNIEVVKSLVGEILLDPEVEAESRRALEEAIVAIANANDSRLAVKLMNRLSRPRTYNVYHAVISACGRSSNPKLGMELFEQMKGDEIKPKRATYNALLHSCSSAGELGDARHILEEMSDEGIRLNVVTYNIALNSRARVGDARGAVNLLAEMNEAGIEPSVVSYATAVNAAAQYNSSGLAMTIMRAMEQDEVAPNEYVFTAAIAACENDPNDEAAAQCAQYVVESMTKVGVVDPDLRERLGMQAKSQLHRNLASLDDEFLKRAESVLGITLRGRQSAI